LQHAEELSGRGSQEGVVGPPAIVDGWGDEFVNASRGELLLEVGIDAAKDGKDEKN